MPATRATATARPWQVLAEQQSPNERRNDQQRHAGRGFAHCGENKHPVHRYRPRLVFSATDPVRDGRHLLVLGFR